ncbi:hypothetical protein VHEMI02962 [[Torrubiella] hemipterigena]|uniref:Uncharacterized protein n=1 Tax=[Torrubiella] hemipterigena TaxID=1531966 RepID=A0A0A1T9F3_9HYPO|nr:hypothetical protein VHEMI02962 [[Torrubiella] hemipterigena]
MADRPATNLLDLSNEILCDIIFFCHSEADLAALARTNNLLHQLANGALYKRNNEERNSSCLSWAAATNSLRTIRFAFQAGADPITAGSPALCHAIREDNIEVARTLLDLGADPDYTYQDSNDKGLPPLCEAIQHSRLQHLKLLREYGANVNKNFLGLPLLLGAVFYWDQNIFEYLLSIGDVDVNARDEDKGNTALHVAIKMKNEDALKFLLAHTKIAIDTRSDFSFTALHNASLWVPKDASATCLKDGRIGEETALSLTKILLDAGANIDMPTDAGHSVLHLAITYGRCRLTEQLLARGASMGWTGDEQKSCMVIAAESNAPIPLIRLLLAHGADIDEVDGNGDYALQTAIERSKLNLIQFLLDQGANPDKTTSRTYGPPLLQARSMPKVMVLLLNYGADPNLPDDGDDGMLASEDWLLNTLAMQGKHHLVALMLDKGADPTRIAYIGGGCRASFAQCVIRGGSLEVVKCALDRKLIDFQSSDYQQHALIFDSFFSDNRRMFDTLLSAGADVTITDEDDHAAPFVAVKRSSVRILRRLLESGLFSVHVTDMHRRTLLIMAASRGETIMMHMLLAAGADINATDRYGTCALAAAMRNGHMDAAELLLKDPRINTELLDRRGRSVFWRWLKRSTKVEDGNIALTAAIESGEEPHLSVFNGRNWDQYCDVCLILFAEGFEGYSCNICYKGRFAMCPSCFDDGWTCLESHGLTLTEEARNSFDGSGSAQMLS